MSMTIPDGLLEATVSDTDSSLYELGHKIGRLYTDHGLPIDMAFDRLPHTKEQKQAILTGALHWLVIHKRNSGATEKAIDKQRAMNVKIAESFAKTGESGVY